MSEPSEPIQPLQAISAKKVVDVPIKTAAIIVKEENYDVDDLIADLDSSRKTKPPAQQPPVKYSKESEAFYRQNSKSNRMLRNKKSLRKEMIDDPFVDEVLEGLGKHLRNAKIKYCQKELLKQDGVKKLYDNRRGVCRPLEVFRETNLKTMKPQLKCWITNVPSDGRLVAIASFKTNEGIYGGYEKLGFDQGETIILVSGSVENSYLLLGYRETDDTIQKRTDCAIVKSIESTTIKPQFSLYPPGNRLYKLPDWDDLGFDSATGTDDIFKIADKPQTLKSGEVPITQALYIAIRDFNPDGKEPPLGPNKIRFLTFRTGELLLLTLEPNKGGWFEGYRASDPDRVCGLSYQACIKKINFM